MGKDSGDDVSNDMGEQARHSIAFWKPPSGACSATYKPPMSTAAIATPEPVVTRPTLVQLLALAGPVVISRAAQVVVGFTDAAMVGQLGESALAATTTGAMNTFNILVLPMGIVMVVQSFAAQMTGKGDGAGARRFAWYGLMVAVLAELMGIASLPFLGDAIAYLDYADDVKALMASYLFYRLLSGGAAIGIEALGAYYGGLGNTRLPMLVQILAMVLNVFLNWVFIYGHLGVPAMGVDGAAIASTLATTTAFLVVLGLFMARVGMKPDPAVLAAAGAVDVDVDALAKASVSPRELSRAEFGRLLRFGLPSGFNWFIEFLAFSVFINAVIPVLGTTSVAALMSVFQLNSVAFMPAFAIASAGAIFVGQAIGADRKDDVGATVRLTAATAAVWMGVVGVVYLVAPRIFLAPFVADSATPEAAARFLDMGARMLMLSCLWQVFDAAAMVLGEALRAAGDTMFTFVARMVIAWVVFVPGVTLTVRVFDGDEQSAILWLAAYLCLLALTLFLRFRTGRWRQIELTEPELV